MCGRFTLKTPASQMMSLFRMDDFPEVMPRDNISPTQLVICIRRMQADAPRQATPMRWGLVPFWADSLSVGSRMINARSETVAQKPAFRRAFKTQRCVIPADGFYEWQALSPETAAGEQTKLLSAADSLFPENPSASTEPPGEEGKASGRRTAKRAAPKRSPRVIKQKWLIHKPGHETFAFAGLWESWMPRQNGSAPEAAQVSPVVLTCTILTTAANSDISPVHDRMPVILTPDQCDTWLSSDASPGQLAELTNSLPPNSLLLTKH